MANHKSALKRIRANETKRQRNKYQLKSCRTVIKKLQAIEEKAQASQLLGPAFSMIDKLAKNHIIHANKGGRLKANLAKHVNALS